MPTLIPVSRTVLLDNTNDSTIFESGFKAIGRLDEFIDMNNNIERVGDTLVVRLCDFDTREEMVQASALVCKNSDMFGKNYVD